MESLPCYIGSAVRSRRDIGNAACDNWSGRCINAYYISRRYGRDKMMRKCLVVVYMPLREMVVTRSESLNGSRRSKAVLTCEVALHVD
jgi:hypothetical protein